MKGDDLQSEHHVARYVGGSQYDSDTGEIIGAAFIPRPADHNLLSVNWLEYFNVSRDECISEIRKAHQSKNRKLGATAIFAILNVGATVAHVTNGAAPQQIRIIEDPEEESIHGHDDPSHAGIVGYSGNAADDQLIAELIAGSVIERAPAQEP